MSRSLFLGLVICVAASATSCRKADDTSQKGSGETPRKPIIVVAFDEDDDTLKGIVDGEVYGTIVQNPYMYGHDSVRILAELAKGNQEVLPKDGVQFFPARSITKDNVNEFWADLKQKQEAGKGDVEHVAGRKSVAYVTNGIASFWNVAAAGAKVAAREAGVNLEIKMPAAPELANQKRILEDLNSREDVTGIAVSPIKPDDQRDLLNTVGDKKHYLTQDSDAPQTNRLVYIGMSNYDAGRDCGKLVKAAMPDGGSIMIFVGRLGQANAKLRRQGLIDELLDRSHDESRYDENKLIKGDKYTILGTMTDDFDFSKAKQNAEDAISKHPDLNCMVGLFAYNPPKCLQAIRAVGREVKPGDGNSASAKSADEKSTGSKTGNAKTE